MNRSIVAIGGLAVLLTAGTVVAQDSGTPSAGGDVQQQVDALSTQVSALTTRVARLEGQRGSGRPPTSVAQAPAAAPTPTATAVKMQTVGLNEIADGVSSWNFLATGTEERYEIYTDEVLTPRGLFLIVQLEVTNVGNEASEFPWRDFRIIDGQGRVFSPNEDATIGYTVYELGSSTADELQPGLTYYFPIVFELPPDAADLVFTSVLLDVGIELGR